MCFIISSYSILDVVDIGIDEQMELVEMVSYRRAFGNFEISGVINNTKFEQRFDHALTTLPSMRQHFRINVGTQVNKLLIVEKAAYASRLEQHTLKVNRKDTIILECIGNPDTHVRMFVSQLLEQNQHIIPYSAVDGDYGGSNISFVLEYGSKLSLSKNAELAIPYINRLGMRAQWLCRQANPFRTSTLPEKKIEAYRARVSAFRKLAHPNKIHLANELEQIAAEGETIDLVNVEPGYVFHRMNVIENAARKANINLRSKPTDGESYQRKIEWFDFLDCKVKWNVDKWLKQDFTVANQVMNAFASLVNKGYSAYKMLPVRCLNAANINIKYTNKQNNDLQFAQTCAGRYVLLRYDKGSKSINVYYTAPQSEIETGEQEEMDAVCKARYPPKTTIHHVYFKHTAEIDIKFSGNFRDFFHSQFNILALNSFYSNLSI